MKEMRSAVAAAEDTVTIRAKHRDAEGKTVVEKVEFHTHNPDTLKHIERKLVDTGVSRLDRHPVDGKGPLKKPPPKKGHGGKFTWEGPETEPETELEAEAAIDERDPNYEEEEEAAEEVAEEVVKGEVEVAKTAEEGVARIDVDPNLVK